MFYSLSPITKGNNMPPCIPILLFLSSLFTCSLPARETKKITLEFAISPEQQTWGLMQRAYLPPNQGMLFSYPSPRIINMWSFNCLIDLSIAFLDQNNTIRTIEELKSYPEKMDPLRPVTKPSEFSLYSPYEPIMLFFRTHGVSSRVPCTYALEMNKNWFKENHVHVGDKIFWDPATSIGYIIPSD